MYKCRPYWTTGRLTLPPPDAHLDHACLPDVEWDRSSIRGRARPGLLWRRVMVKSRWMVLPGLAAFLILAAPLRAGVPKVQLIEDFTEVS